MSEAYNPKTIEPKWQKIWDDEKAFHAPNDYTKPKCTTWWSSPTLRARACT